MSAENGKVCCNCKHCIRNHDEKYDMIVCNCEINNVYLSYAKVLASFCDRWEMKDAENEYIKQDVVAVRSC